MYFYKDMFYPLSKNNIFVQIYILLQSMKRLIFSFAVFSCIISGCCNQNSQEMSENPVIDAIMARRSIRHYNDSPVEREILQKIAECGINAPNAMNKQQWEIRIVDDKAFFDGATEIMKDVMPFMIKTDDPKFRNGFRNCSAAFFIACPEDGSGMLLQNVGLMSENICLAAQSLGLGTCVMGGPAMFLNNTPAAKPYLDRLNFSDGYILRTVIAVGYPDEQPEAKPRDISKIRFVE